jgi:transcriptional regulator with XRE-family HTH domain
MAARMGISRAALYRYEKGRPPKLEKLEAMAGALGVSLATLLGVGVEYVASAASFFERMRQAEEEATHLFAMFGPVPYALTTDRFDELLPTVLREGLRLGPAHGPTPNPGHGPAEADRARTERLFDDVAGSLRRRKEGYRRRLPSLVGLVSRPEIERFARNGFIGAFGLPAEERRERRRVARAEVENVIAILENPPLGVQIGLLADAIPNITFQLFRQPGRTVLAMSPFRLGDFPNVSTGVGMFTHSPEPVELYEEMTRTLWDGALKGTEAAAYLRRILRAAAREDAVHEQAAREEAASAAPGPPGA